MKTPSIQFQVIIDSNNFFISKSVDGNRIRANITGIEADQIPVLVDGIIDAGPEAVSYFREAIEEKLNVRITDNR